MCRFRTLGGNPEFGSAEPAALSFFRSTSRKIAELWECDQDYACRLYSSEAKLQHSVESWS